MKLSRVMMERILEELKFSYLVSSLLTINEISVLELTKDDPVYKDDYTSIDFWIDKKLYLPAKIVAVSTALKGIPVFCKIDGLTTIMYIAARKVAVPARTSVRRLVLGFEISDIVFIKMFPKSLN